MIESKQVAEHFLPITRQTFPFLVSFNPKIQQLLAKNPKVLNRL